MRRHGRRTRSDERQRVKKPLYRGACPRGERKESEKSARSREAPPCEHTRSAAARTQGGSASDPRAAPACAAGGGESAEGERALKTAKAVLKASEASFTDREAVKTSACELSDRRSRAATAVAQAQLSREKRRALSRDCRRRVASRRRGISRTGRRAYST